VVRKVEMVEPADRVRSAVLVAAQEDWAALEVYSVASEVYSVAPAALA
jgi:hypothetical protein